MTTIKTRIEHEIVKEMVKEILEFPWHRKWTLQGFGMLRTYLTPELRLHIWNSRYQNENVSEIHTHPWHFYSFVVAGEVFNTRYGENEDIIAKELLPMHRQTIRCGEGGGLVGEPQKVLLRPLQTERYVAGETYSQFAREIHRSIPRDGTVTIIKREFLDDTEHAYVYFEDEWVTAEPREASDKEIIDITKNALEKWF